MAWSESDSLKDQFEAARQFWSDEQAAQSYQGFTKALRHNGMKMLYQTRHDLRQYIVQQADAHLRMYGFFILAVDGTCIELPRTEQHHRVFGVHGKTGGSPQMRLTMMWMLKVGAPWNWQFNSSRISERTQLLSMLNDTPDDTLLIADAGFTGYHFLRKIIDKDRHFLLRVGKQIHVLRQLEKDIREVGCVKQVGQDMIHLWPNIAQAQGELPLELRMITLRGKHGRRKMTLLTSVLDVEQLSDEAALELYRERWHVEVGFRTTKQTLKGRKLRSHAPAQALFEMHGLMLGLLMLRMMSALSKVVAGKPPLSDSIAGVLRVMQRAMRQPKLKRCWLKLLREVEHDTYVRKRKTRVAYPRKKPYEPPPTGPKIRNATPNEIIRYQQLIHQ